MEIIFRRGHYVHDGYTMNILTITCDVKLELIYGILVYIHTCCMTNERQIISRKHNYEESTIICIPWLESNTFKYRRTERMSNSELVKKIMDDINGMSRQYQPY